MAFRGKEQDQNIGDWGMYLKCSLKPFDYSYSIFGSSRYRGSLFLFLILQSRSF